MEKSEHDVYISCAEENRRAADIIQSAIEKRGIPCKSTPGDASGNTLSETAEDAIKRSKVLIVVYSRHANGCIPLTREVAFAASQEMFILPFPIDNAPMSKELEFYLSAYHWFDAVGDDPESAVNELVARAEFLTTQDPSDSTSSSDQPGLSRRRHGVRSKSRPATLIASITIVSLAAIAFWTRSSNVGLGDDTATVQSATDTPEAKPIKVEPAIETTWHTEENEGILELPGGVAVQFVWCPPGTFSMGRGVIQGTPHDVKIENGFWLGKFEVTQEQWRAVTGETPRNDTDDVKEPVGHLHWRDAKRFIRMLNGPDQGPYGLPTEAEWEYAALAGGSTEVWMRTQDQLIIETIRGRITRDLGDLAWFEDNSGGMPHRVGGKSPNTWGLFDMFGNVWEACAREREDDSDLAWFGIKYRGGAWRSAPRDFLLEDPSIVQDTTSGILGFRLYRDGLEGDPAVGIDSADDATDGNEIAALSDQGIANLQKAKWEVSDYEASLTLGDGTKVEFMWCPPGIFYVGEGEYYKWAPQAEVTFAKGFWLGKYEVTRAQWQVVMESDVSRFEKPDHPVETVSWEDCQQFIKGLNTADKGTFRLPTSAEWEYACRAGGVPVGWKNSASDQTSDFLAGKLGDWAWSYENSFGTTRPVGLKWANEWGFHDMLGNVGEWCQDWGGDYPDFGYPDPAIDPAGPTAETDRVHRGGSRSDLYFSITSWKYRHSPPDSRKMNLGFRLLRED